MKIRKNGKIARPCQWCGSEFRAGMWHGRRTRFCQRACFVAAKRAWGVVRREAA